MGALISLFIQAIMLTVSLTFSVLFMSLRMFGLLFSLLARSGRSYRRYAGPVRRSVPKASSGGAQRKQMLPPPVISLLVIAVFLLIVVGAFGANIIAGLVISLVLIIAGVVWLIRQRGPQTATAQQLSTRFGAVGSMSGAQFEIFTADMLRAMGYGATVLGSSGDQGVDIIATSGDERIAVQCKNYKKSVGNKPVQEVYAGARHHGCNKAWVMAPGGFTKGAFDLAGSVGVSLFDSSSIGQWITKVDKIVAQPVKTKHKTQHIPEGDPLQEPLERSAAELAIGRDRLSVSDISRALDIGYSKAGRMMDVLEKRGVVSSLDSSEARTVLVSDDSIRELLERR